MKKGPLQKKTSLYFQVKLKRPRVRGYIGCGKIKVRQLVGGKWKVVASFKSEDEAIKRLVEIAEKIRRLEREK